MVFKQLRQSWTEGTRNAMVEDVGVVLKKNRGVKQRRWADQGWARNEGDEVPMYFTSFDRLRSMYIHQKFVRHRWSLDPLPNEIYTASFPHRTLPWNNHRPGSNRARHRNDFYRFHRRLGRLLERHDEVSRVGWLDRRDWVGKQGRIGQARGAPGPRLGSLCGVGWHRCKLGWGVISMMIGFRDWMLEGGSSRSKSSPIIQRQQFIYHRRRPNLIKSARILYKKQICLTTHY